MTDPGPSGPEYPLPPWLLWRRRYGSLPSPWDHPWVPPWAYSSDLPAPWSDSLPGPETPQAGIPTSSVQAPELPPTPVSVRLGFPLFGAGLVLPAAIILLVIFGHGLGWADWLAYVLGGALGLVVLGGFWLGLTAPHPPDDTPPTA